MGVSGSGKSTLAAALAAELNLPMAEADEFHPPENIAKMASQTPLTDEDRWPWLDALRDWMSSQAETGSVITCSALRRTYRDVLRSARGRVVFLHVDVEIPRLNTRLAHRSGHFMPPALLESQLSTLEALDPDEDGIVLANDSTVEDLLESARAWLRAEISSTETSSTETSSTETNTPETNTPEITGKPDPS
ncbi:gluconokinase [Nesterenkonia jeotgali]|uniref:Gluconokinase n=1 Tax=Nesterenkonia jeotgali TaxID=317018 RepID=A0A839FPW4_9MICC|nr:gluconokinase [Nesterenkonia jeotgali]MBA8920661.1 gluconokinase [Nesterenkonia jeotgali]